MKSCPQCDKQLDDDARFCSNCGVSQEQKMELPSPDFSDLRARLNRLDDPQIDALAIECFPEVKAKFSDGMRRDAKVNLVLDHCRRNPEAIPTLENRLNKQPATCDPQDALACYLSHVIAENSRLQLQGIRSASGLVSIDLEDIYVTLMTTVRKTVAGMETWDEETATVEIQEALALYQRLVVLGHPGCGKTTLLRYLTLTYARDFRDNGQQTINSESWVKQRLGLDENYMPILLPLRDFARYLEKECPDNGVDGPKLLLDYLHTYFRNQQVILPADFFESRLKMGECAVLFDGVDEIASMIELTPIC